MSGAATEFFRLLAHFEPKWALALLVAGILSWHSPKLVKELSAGTRGLLLARRPSKGAGRR